MHTICVLSGAHVILILAIIIVIAIVVAVVWIVKGISGLRKSNTQPSNSTFQQVINEQAPPQPTLHIPDTCPFCKRPNTRRTRLCEWCGEQIC